MKLLIDKLQDSKPSWNVKSFPLGDDAPRKKLTVIVTALSRCSKEIRSPVSARVHGADVYRRDGYTHFGGPNMVLRIDAGCMRKA